MGNPGMEWGKWGECEESGGCGESRWECREWGCECGEYEECGV